MSIRWVESSSGMSWTGVLPNGFHIHVMKYDDGWSVQFGPATLDKRFASLYPAQKAGIELARRILTECLIKLSEE